MTIQDKLKHELKGCTIHDNYIQNSSIDGKPIEYLIISIGSHHYAISYQEWYVINEIETPTRDAYSLSDCMVMSGNKLREYIKHLKIKNIVN